MGNNLCCEEEIKKEPDATVTVIHKEQVIQIPDLTREVQDNLERQRPFENQFVGKLKTKKFGDDVYQGRLDEAGRPDGYGRMYKSNGSVFVGYFDKGVACGDGHYVTANGNFYHGKMYNNKANDKSAQYWCPGFKYSGGVVDNEFEGQGEEIGDNHTFTGTYVENKRSEGVLKWKQNGKQYEYEGPFNKQGHFHGKGRLYMEQKGTYEGEFSNGIKHGFGQFSFNTGLKYIGQYRNGIREGTGKIVNKNGAVAYDGEFKNDMPNGKGKAPTKQGKMQEREWVDGIDKQTLD